MSDSSDPPLRPEPLAGSRVTLRPAAATDAGAFAAILADPSVARWWPSDDPAADGRRYATRDDVAVWAIELGYVVVGLIQAWEEPESQYRHAGIDLGLAPGAQGQGLGPDAIRAVATWLFEHRGHHRITIDPCADNERAVHAYADVGFRPVGIMRRYQRLGDGRWHDGLLMDLLADDLDVQRG